MDSRGNIGNVSPFSQTPASVLKNVKPATLRLETANEGAREAGLINILNSMQAQINSLTTALSDLQSKFNAHVHSGITAGAANSGAPTTTSTASAGSSLSVL